MKVHISVDVGRGYVHAVIGTAANVSDMSEIGHLIREDDRMVYRDSGYLDAAEHMPPLKDDGSSIEFRINKRPSSIKVAKGYKGIRWDDEIASHKSSMRCKVEHPFLIVKCQFGY